MSFRVTLPATLRDALAATDRPLIGMWACSGSALVAEICAGAGLDWLLIDAEHSPNSPESVLSQLQAVGAYGTVPVVRPPVGDVVTIKRYLDIGAQSLLIPMIESAEQAAAVVRATRYPPEGVRGVGSALARSSRWNRVDGYLENAAGSISVIVQIESEAGVERVDEILDVAGVDGIFVGPSDLAASMGFLGQQEHPAVVAAALHCIERAKARGIPAGVNAFVPATADHYLEAGVRFVLVGADVSVLARAAEGFADRFITAREAATRRTSY